MKILKIQAALILLAAFLLATSRPLLANDQEIRLSAAASMTDALKELANAYRTSHPEVTILSNFGPSGGLAKQIVLGAPADLFISANAKWMDYLVKEGKVTKDSVRFFATNTLVFAGMPKEGVTSLKDLPSLDRIAIGSPLSVPAGQYAQQAMRRAGIYERLLQANKLVMAKDVRQALLYADRGEVDGAFVYRTDALLARQAALLFPVPSNLYDSIACPIGLTIEGERNDAARALYAFLTGPAALAVLEKYGFSAPALTPASAPDSGSN